VNDANSRTLEERVADLEAEWAIRNLMSTYLLKADTRDVEGYANMFCEDGILDIEGLHFDKVGFEVTNVNQGTQAIAKAYSEYIAPVPCFMWHLAHSPHIEVNGDQATGRWGWTAIVNVPLFGPMQAGGVYNDEYQKTSAGWKIKKRAITSYFSMEYGTWNEDLFFGSIQ
jgi:hypothetical protein